MISEHASPLAAIGGEDAGGQNVYVAALSRTLARQGHHVTVYTRRDAPSQPAAVEVDAGFDVVHIDAGPPRPVAKDELLPWMPDFGSRVAEDWVQRGIPDVVHAHFWMSGVAAGYATRTVPVPRVQTFHALGAVKRRYQGAADTSPAGRIGIESALARDSDLVIATCRDEVRELVATGAHADRVDVIPCGVDLTAFDMAVTGEITTRPRIVSLTRLVERKGMETVIRALPLLPDVEFVIAGGPPAEHVGEDSHARHLVRLAGELGVADRVELRGAVPHQEIAALLGSADVVACTPWYEPFGMVALEAMACGRPVVASAVGGLLDTVRDGVTGYHVPPRDPQATAHAIRAIVDDPSLAMSMARAGRALVERRYGWEQIAADTAEAYQRAITLHGDRPLTTVGTTRDWLKAKTTALTAALEWLSARAPVLDRWGSYLACHLSHGGRVLAAGNGGSAAEAQHFTAELVGRFTRDRRPLSALCLSAETSSLTAIVNDYGGEQAFARQVQAHARPGDVLLLLSTSGASPNVLAAARVAREMGVLTLAFTGSAPNELATLVDTALCVPGSTSTAQEVHLMLVHALCAVIDAQIADWTSRDAVAPPLMAPWPVPSDGARTGCPDSTVPSRRIVETGQAAMARLEGLR